MAKAKKVKNKIENSETHNAPKLSSSESNMSQLTQSRAMRLKYQLFPSERAYAEGFGPESKLAKFLKTPIPPKTAGVVSLIVAACIVIFSCISIFPSFFQGKQIDQTAIIKSAQTQTIKTVSIVAGGQPVEWITLVERSDINSAQYLLKLPKGAKNIKIQTIAPKQANDILSAKPKEQLSLKQRAQIAEANQPKSFFVASLLDSISKFFLSDLSGVVQNVVESTNSDITSTPDATIVDLSSQAETSAPSETPAPVLTTINVTPLTADLTVGGAAQQLTAATLDQNGASISATLTWTSDNISVATVDSTGLVTPIGAGTANITASSGSVASSVPSVVTVTATSASAPSETPAPVLTTINVTPLTADLTVGGAAQQLTAATLDQNGASISATLTWTSDNISVATVDSTGLVTPIGAGTANITASSGSVASSVPSAVTVTAASYVAVQYTTPAPQITTQPTDTGVQVTISATNEDPANPIVDILASTKIPKIYKVGEENKIHIKWKNNGNQNVTFTAYDTDGDGYLDYVEWTVPHLSDQIFDIIFISKAFQLDQDQNIIADIYDQTYAKDDIWASLTDGQYVRATFNAALDNTKDITVYARPTDPNSPGSMQVYPVYTDADGNQTEGGQLTTVSDGQNPDFSKIDHDGKYRVLLTNLQTPTDVFDLKISGNIDIDYIVDPTVGDSYTDETKIGFGIAAGVHTDTTNVVNSSGIALAPCYTASPSWSFVATSNVRDISQVSGTVYINKDIYCDNTNCILYTNGQIPPATICIANTSPDSGVYAHLLWSKTDVSGTKAWATGTNGGLAISGGDVGGTHPASYTAGSTSASIANKNWLERYYTSPPCNASLCYPAMDACKAMGLGWRVPNILELDSIRTSSAQPGTIYSNLPNIISYYYWSSSETSAADGFALYFTSGSAGGNLTKSNAYYVRCVRGY